MLDIVISTAAGGASSATDPDVEIPGTPVPRGHIEHCYHRYRTVVPMIDGQEVLEVACGTGVGLGLLARSARRAVAGDRSMRNVLLARAHYGAEIPLVVLDAHELPFRSESFDAVVLIEAIYFLERPERFVLEARRVLRRDGLLFVASVNPRWRDFRPHRRAHRYLDSRELADLIRHRGFDTEVWGAFRTDPGGRSAAFSVLRRAAWRVGSLDRSTRLRALLRRLAYGAPVPFPAEVTEGAFEYRPPERIPPGAAESAHLYLYAIGRRTVLAPDPVSP
jgi:SAM-dependent methyltransferase